MMYKLLGFLNPLVFIPTLIVCLVLYFVFDVSWWALLIGLFFFVFVLGETSAQRRKRIIDEVKKESEKRRKDN